ncbi:hypothetical protein PZ938_03060 [Luteipulveratus sp. YIM 133132]|uniref:hypothetical protein n=1 Tax=Luteipulveratus flavus TaxID=3031728 RepID=UPI0023AEA75A|nr:hypothetical protein [Luteipulveratus sp. YIM 133132]MDE9364572.1 hypothetical protein [Luteipulveratus sp. YIM 133132]
MLHATVIETSVWCPVCLLPSVVRFNLHALCVHGVRFIGTGTRCTEHEADGRSS